MAKSWESSFHLIFPPICIQLPFLFIYSIVVVVPFSFFRFNLILTSFESSVEVPLFPTFKVCRQKVCLAEKSAAIKNCLFKLVPPMFQFAAKNPAYSYWVFRPKKAKNLLQKSKGKIVINLPTKSSVKLWVNLHSDRVNQPRPRGIVVGVLTRRCIPTKKNAVKRLCNRRTKMRTAYFQNFKM